MTNKKFVLLAPLLLITSQVFAEQTVGGLLDKGALKVGKAEIEELLPASIFFKWIATEGEATLTYTKDGTLTGIAKEYLFDTESRSDGTWTLDSDGKMCIKEFFQNWAMNYEACYQYYRIGKEYYVSYFDSKRSDEAQKAMIEPIKIEK